MEVYWATDAQDAHLAKALLEDAGIAARVVGEMLLGVVGELPMGPNTAPRVWVAASDAERARALVAEWEKRTPKGVAWSCANCGENVGGQFDLCWNCESPRPPE